MIDDDESAFLDLLYGAALEPTRWVEVMERLAVLVGGTGGWLSYLDQVDGRGSGFLLRIDPGLSVAYNAHYCRLNPFIGKDPAAIEAWRPTIRTDEDVVDKSDLTRTEYYNDFLRLAGAHSFMMISLTQDGRRRSVMNITRPQGAEQFGRRELDTARRLHPHLIRAMTLGLRLSADRSLNGGAAAVFDRSSHGLFHLDRDGRLVRLNTTGEALLAAGGPLTVRGGRLTAVEPAAARRLAGLIAASVSGDRTAFGGGAMTLATPTRALPLSVIVSPLPSTDLPLFEGRPGALVCVTDPQAGIGASERRLRELFDLTPAEARVALALTDGATVSEAAARLGVSVHTARLHLAHIFEKTGVGRQAALVRLLMRADGPGLS